MSVVLLPWINLFHYYKGIEYNPIDNHRKYKSWVGMDPFDAETVFTKYFHNHFLSERSHLLIVLHFLKTMPTEDEGASEFKVKTRTTYRKRLWSTLYYLDYIMNEVNLENRFSPFVPRNGVFSHITLIIDGTECPIERPCDIRERFLYSNGRPKENIYSRYNLKYTIACQICSGKICAIIGPDPGSMSDIQGLKNGELIGYIISRDPLEIVLADKGYQGHPQCLTPFKGEVSPEEAAFNEVLASVRILVECVIQRLKIFGVLGRKGRFRCNNESHKSVFNVVCQLTNILMERSPVWQNRNYYLF